MIHSVSLKELKHGMHPLPHDRWVIFGYLMLFLFLLLPIAIGM
jgi:hypothetical protein